MSHRNTLWCSTSWFASFSFLALEAKLRILFNNHNKGFEMYMYIKSSHHTGRFFWPPLIPWVKSDFSFNSLTSTSQFLYQSLGQFRLIKWFFFYVLTVGEQNRKHRRTQGRVLIGFANSMQEHAQSDWFVKQSTWTRCCHIWFGGPPLCLGHSF